MTQQPATFGWLCVETPSDAAAVAAVFGQPPSGGCVLKQHNAVAHRTAASPATFGWLCVETGRSV